MNNANRLVKVKGLELTGICFGLTTQKSDVNVIQSSLKESHPDITFYSAQQNDHFLKIDWSNKTDPFADINFEELS